MPLEPDRRNQGATRRAAVECARACGAPRQVPCFPFSHFLLQSACRSMNFKLLEHWRPGDRRIVLSLRGMLLLLLVLATVPMAALMSWQIVDDLRSDEARRQARLVASAEALAKAVERELDSSVDALNILALSDRLRSDDPAAFERWMNAAGRLRGTWHSAVLLDAGGRALMDTGGGAPDLVSDAAAPWRPPLHSVLGGASSGISGLGVEPGSHLYATLVMVPVRVAGRPRYALGVWIPVGNWQALLAQAVPLEAGVGMLCDASGRVIARTASPEQVIGRPVCDLSPDRPVDRRRQPDGEDAWVAVHRIEPAGWHVSVAHAAAPVEAVQRHAVATALATVAGCLLLGMSSALLVARRITQPLELLADGRPALAAPGLQAREIVALDLAMRLARQRDEQARAELQRRADEFETLFHSTPIGLAVAQDPHCRQVIHNAAMDRLLGPAGPAMAGDAPWQLLRDDKPLQRDGWPLCAAARGGEPVDGVELDLARPGQERLRVIASATPLLDDHGRPRGAIAAMVDISEQRRAQLLHAALVSVERQSREKSEAAHRAKDELLAMLGHELRNPLGAISSAAEVLATGPAPALAANAVEIIGRQTRHLTRLMADMLDTSRLMYGAVPLARQRVDLAVLARQVVEGAAGTRAAARHTLSTSLEEAWAELDPARIEQVLGQLLANALTYTPAGGTVRVEVRHEDLAAVLRVRDSGPGIPDDLLPRVFDLFAQGARSSDRRDGGLGLGLTVVKRLVELHGGSVAIESSAEGTCVELRLPAVPPPVQAPVQAAGDGWRRAGPARRVLVIEDNPDALAALRALLGVDGHEVHAESDGRAGLEALLARRPDLAIVDIGLPSIDGLQVARHARAQGYPGRMVALTGYGRDGDVQRSLKAGFDAHLVKPIEREQLRRELAETWPLTHP
jgi:signal transduction histidine kinase